MYYCYLPQPLLLLASFTCVLVSPAHLYMYRPFTHCLPTIICVMLMSIVCFILFSFCTLLLCFFLLFSIPLVSLYGLTTSFVINSKKDYFNWFKCEPVLLWYITKITFI